MRTIVPGKSGDSLLVQRILGVGEQARMPMGGKPLPPEKIGLIKQWIDAGAVWPDSTGAESAEVKKHWAFIAPKRPALPTVKASTWAAAPIDRFILAKLESEKLTPSTPRINPPCCGALALT